MNPGTFRLGALSLCCATVTAIATPYFLSAERPKVIPREEIDRSVIAALSHQGITKLRIVSHVDLTGPFATVTQWTFVVVQDVSHPIPDSEEQGPISVCLVKGTSSDCALHLYEQGPTFHTPYHLFAGSIVNSGQKTTNPLLLVKVCGEVGGDGDCGIATALYRYDNTNDRFIRVFLNFTGRNNNQATRFVEGGLLQGDVIVDNPTDNPPYNYWIEVYRAGESGQYGRILRYRSLTSYSDGNPLAVADSEMPEILRRLGLWKPGDPLPVPAHMPPGCKKLFVQRGEEWCR